MKRILFSILALFLFSACLLGCSTGDPAETDHTDNSAETDHTDIGTHIFHDGALYEVNTDETYSMALVGEELTDAVLIDPDTLPTKEGECNARAETAQIYDDGHGFFMVILDGEEYPVKKVRNAWWR